MLFRFAMWLLDLSGKKRRKIEKEAVERWCNANLWYSNDKAITTWWDTNKGAKKAEFIREWSESRPTIVVEVEKDKRGRFRCVARDEESDPIVVSSGFGYKNMDNLTARLGKLRMVNLEFKEVVSEPKKPKGAKKPKGGG